jgi:hypothetical protein
MFKIIVVEKIEAQILCSVTFSENRAVYEIMSKQLVEPERPKMAIWRRVVCWIRLHARKHTPAPVHARRHADNTHTHKCVILIAFLQQQWFRKRPSMLYVHCPSSEKQSSLYNPHLHASTSAMGIIHETKTIPCFYGTLTLHSQIRINSPSDPTVHQFIS